MNSSKRELKRARPALGTILLLRLEAPEELTDRAIDDVLSQAFDLGEELENRFSKFREASDVSRLNQASLNRDIPVGQEFRELTLLALEIWRASNGAFTPFMTPPAGPSPLIFSEERAACFARKTVAAELDLSGIAKGFIVDKIHDFITAALPGLAGVINAGGDLRFFNTKFREADVRLTGGSSARRIRINQDCIATSAVVESLSGTLSTTVYTQAPRFSRENVVSAMASTCALADAMTKVGWFGTEAAITACAEKFNAQVLIFNANGDISQSFGKP